MSQATVPRSKSTANRNLAADTFSRSIIWLACLILMQRGIGFLRSFYVCGALAPSDVGQWDLSLSFLSMAAPLAVLGIPGSFGRYIARFETKGQERRFLNHTLLGCLALTAMAVTSILVLRETIATYFFGDASYSGLVGLLAIGLPLVIYYNFSNSWFTGKRLNRVVFRTQFAQTVLFAALCVVAFQFYRVDATSVVAAYLLSCLAGLAIAGWYLLIGRDSSEPQSLHTEKLAIWSKVLPFAIWVWATNLVFHLFSLCDRMLLVNFHPTTSLDVESLVGQYHTACIFPLLLLTIGDMAGSMLIPYLSKDWENQDHAGVADRLNLMAKGIGVLCLLGSIAILLIAPVLFSGIWKDKFSTGEALLPMTLSYCSLAAVALVAQKYFWCIEKTWWSTVLLCMGLLTNFGLGVYLITDYGIQGVVASTLAAHIVVLVTVLLICHREGLKIDAGVYLISVALLGICFGKLSAALCFAIIMVAIVCSETIVTTNEKRAALDRGRSILGRALGKSS